MTGKKNKLRRVNCLTISRGWDGVWRVRSPERPHRVLYEAPDQEKAYRWAHRHREFTQRTPIWTEEELSTLTTTMVCYQPSGSVGILDGHAMP